MKILFDRIDEPGLNTLRGLRAPRRLRVAAQGADDGARRGARARSSESGLRGRGGAGFQMGKKASFLPHGDMDKYLVCNADESEPGTFKDRELMQKSPHMLIEGIVIATWAAEINRAFIYIRGEYAPPGRHPRGGDRRGRARPATSASGSSAPSTRSSLVLHRGAGAYICGEETGLLDSLEGKRGNPRLKPPFPAIEGLYHGPTLINNVETLCHRAAHHPDGRRRSTRSSAPRPRPGTKLVSVSGDVQRPGNYEIELGIPVAGDHLRPRRRPAARAARSSSGSPAARAPRC